MNTKILMVDDDPNILAAYKRQLKSRYTVETAKGAEEALAVLMEDGPYAVVISDLKMPGMDGIEFLSNIKEKYPDTVRILLTGYAELETAIEAVNQGNVFRFLTKPAPPAVLTRVIQDALEQYRLITSERELLEKTLSSSVKVLTEILAIVNPDAFSRTNRLSRIVNYIAMEMGLENLWEFQLAGMLSQIGWVTLPPEILDKIYSNSSLEKAEMSMYLEHPHTAERLLGKIPRMERVAGMIALQLDPSLAKDDLSDIVRMGARIIQLAAEYDKATINGMSHSLAISRFKQTAEGANLELIKYLDGFQNKDRSGRDAVKRLYIKDIQLGMSLEESVMTKRGMLLASKGQEVTHTVLLRLRNFSRSEGVSEPVLMRIPAIS